MSKYFDVKIVGWERYYLPDDIDLNFIRSKSDVIQLMEDCYNLNKALESDVIVETLEWLEVEDNNGESTIEIFEEGSLIWSNETI